MTEFDFPGWASFNGVQCVRAEDGEWVLVYADGDEDDHDDDTSSEYESVACEEAAPIHTQPDRPAKSPERPRFERKVKEASNPQRVAFAQTQLAVACGLIPAQLAPTALLATGVGLQAESLFTKESRPERHSKHQRRASGHQQALTPKVNFSRVSKDFKQRR